MTPPGALVLMELSSNEPVAAAERFVAGRPLADRQVPRRDTRREGGFMSCFRIPGFLMAACVLLALVGASDAWARPQYYKAFVGRYAKVKAARTVRCYVCHVKGKSKETRNVYGTALRKALASKNVKDATKIAEAMKKAEAQKSAIEGKTFGDLLKAGKLPASTQ